MQDPEIRMLARFLEDIRAKMASTEDTERVLLSGKDLDALIAALVAEG